MTQHTPAPWGVFQDASGDVFISAKETSFHIAEVGSEDDETVIPDARRIVACVNACAGWTTEQLEAMELGSMKETISRLADSSSDAATWETRATKEASRAADLQAQVGELLAALKTIGVHTITDEDGDEIEVLFGSIRKIREVISKHTGEPK